jgi:hypothetical protein
MPQLLRHYPSGLVARDEIANGSGPQFLATPKGMWRKSQ